MTLVQSEVVFGVSYITLIWVIDYFKNKWRK